MVPVLESTSIFIALQTTISLAGVLVCGYRSYGLRKLRPHVELQSSGQRESVGNGAETKRPTGHGYDTFVMSSPPTWKR
jgi:hypothetical protein